MYERVYVWHGGIFIKFVRRHEKLIVKNIFEIFYGVVRTMYVQWTAAAAKVEYQFIKTDMPAYIQTYIHKYVVIVFKRNVTHNKKWIIFF